MIEIHENIIEPNIAKDLELYLTSDMIQWNYMESTVRQKWEAEYNNHPGLLESAQLVKLVYGSNKVEDNEIFHRCTPIIQNFWKKKNITGGRIHKIKVNTLMRDTDFDGEKFNSPHADFVNVENEQKHYTSLLYYVNDSDGDTFFFNQFDRRIDPAPSFQTETDWWANRENAKYKAPEKFDLEIKQRISPQSGTAVSFPSNLYHASSNPFNTKRRLVINFVMDLNNADNR